MDSGRNINRSGGLIDAIKRNTFAIFILCLLITSIVGIWFVINGTLSAYWLLGTLIWGKTCQVMGHNIGLHRLYTHRSFTTSVTWQYIIAGFSVLCGISKPINYVYNHRMHHKYSDSDKDPHSPEHTGLLKSITGMWIIQGPKESKFNVSVKDAIRDPFVSFTSKYYFLLWAALIALTLAINWKITMFLVIMPGAFNFFDVNLFLVYLGHNWGKYGYRNFDIADTSSNNKWAQYWTLGDGLHNNHHKYPSNYYKAIMPYEVDFTGWIIKNWIKR
jgi:stearoyl-CoA desaturase (delta-9 desaturase)